MNFCGPYDKQLAQQHRPFLPTPLHAGWEFRQHPMALTGKAGWRSVAKAQDWALTASMRRELLSDKWVVVITDLDQVIQYANPRFEEMTGYTTLEAVGRRPGFLQGEGTSPQVRQRIKQALVLRQPIRTHILNYRKDQTAYWCRIMIRPIINQQKQVVNFIAFEQEVLSDEHEA
jgi:PAS domain S-box-containing protein